MNCYKVTFVITAFILMNGIVIHVMKELIIEANIEKLHEVINFVNEELERNHCPTGYHINVDLAVEEIFVNIAHYAYPPSGGKVVITVTVGEEVVIQFEDTGKSYNPLEHPDPDLDMPVMERKIGGLGIFLVKKVMDKVDYMRIDNKNVLVITKKTN